MVDAGFGAVSPGTEWKVKRKLVGRDLLDRYGNAKEGSHGQIVVYDIPQRRNVMVGGGANESQYAPAVWVCEVPDGVVSNGT